MVAAMRSSPGTRPRFVAWTIEDSVTGQTGNRSLNRVAGALFVWIFILVDNSIDSSGSDRSR